MNLQSVSELFRNHRFPPFDSVFFVFLFCSKSALKELDLGFQSYVLSVRALVHPQQGICSLVLDPFQTPGRSNISSSRRLHLRVFFLAGG